MRKNKAMLCEYYDPCSAKICYRKSCSVCVHFGSLCFMCCMIRVSSSSNGLVFDSVFSGPRIEVNGVPCIE